MIGSPEVFAAAEGLAPFIRRTPQVILEAGALGDGSPAIVLKLELLQRSESFKARGAMRQLRHRIDQAKIEGVVAASGGNFGIAVADAARTFGVPATIFVTTLTSKAKVDRLELVGAVETQRTPTLHAALAAGEPVDVEVGGRCADRWWAACRIYAEPGGATALAAVTSGAYVPPGPEVTVVVVCGGNGDPADL